MKVLLDTHAVAWWLLDSGRLTRKSHAVIADPDNEIWVSSVSAFEMATKFRIGKWPNIGGLVQNFESAIKAENFLLLSINAAHAAHGGMMASPHRDPFDRLLAAQAILDGMMLVTNDPVFKVFGVEVLW